MTTYHRSRSQRVQRLLDMTVDSSTAGLDSTFMRRPRDYEAQLWKSRHDREFEGEFTQQAREDMAEERYSTVSKHRAVRSQQEALRAIVKSKAWDPNQVSPLSGSSTSNLQQRTLSRIPTDTSTDSYPSPTIAQPTPINSQMSSFPTTLPRQTYQQRERDLAKIPAALRHQLITTSTLSRRQATDLLATTQTLPSEAFPRLSTMPADLKFHGSSFTSVARNTTASPSIGGDIRVPSTHTGTLDAETSLIDAAPLTQVTLPQSAIDLNTRPRSDFSLTKSSAYSGFRRPELTSLEDPRVPSSLFSVRSERTIVQSLTQPNTPQVEMRRMTSSTLQKPLPTSVEARVFERELEGERRTERWKKEARKAETEEEKMRMARLMKRRKDALEKQQVNRLHSFSQALYLQQPHAVSAATGTSTNRKKRKEEKKEEEEEEGLSGRPAPSWDPSKYNRAREAMTAGLLRQEEIARKKREEEERKEEERLALEAQDTARFMSFVQNRFMPRPITQTIHTSNVSSPAAVRLVVRREGRVKKMVREEEREKVGKDGFRNAEERLEYFRSRRRERDREEEERRVEEQRRELEREREMEGQKEEIFEEEDDWDRQEEERMKAEEARELARLEEEREKREEERIKAEQALAERNLANEEAMKAQDERRRMAQEDRNASMTNTRSRLLGELTTEASSPGLFSPASVKSRQQQMWPDAEGTPHSLSSSVSGDVGRRGSVVEARRRSLDPERVQATVESQVRTVTLASTLSKSNFHPLVLPKFPERKNALPVNSNTREQQKAEGADKVVEKRPVSAMVGSGEKRMEAGAMSGRRKNVRIDGEWIGGGKGTDPPKEKPPHTTRSDGFVDY
ncbi:hypothetical protein BLNAU_6081 [Blattamonas nauphoetae]|uniref:Uncharacterized protein n=1 Tax=Blattamonas nauphoetae TaxID=2049346 RepID=A0ABQ9Y515_9EUKA|nr:hypothetical protein BLNAU_6081 [Blattamonas nauphoetae]